ncbi:MAG: hypothetical protein JXQ71_15610 [Verrucomicrobia bacterium]|nr:hypothetical protein [Verrucomicrobiota bacterium]
MTNAKPLTQFLSETATFKMPRPSCGFRSALAVLVALGVGAIQTSCSKAPENAERAEKPKQIKGQVFIVQNNAQTVKLGAVQVRVLKSSPELEQRIAARHDEAATNLLALRRTKEQLASQLRALKQTTEKHRSSTAEALRAIQLCDENLYYAKEYIGAKTNLVEGKLEARKYILEYPALKKEKEALHESLAAKLGTLESDLAKLNQTLDSIDTAINRWQDLQTYFGQLPSGEVASTVTDSEGRFAVELPSNGRFLFCAQSSRLVVTETEKYGWIVPLETTNESELILSNHNLLVPTQTGLAQPGL